MFCRNELVAEVYVKIVHHSLESGYQTSQLWTPITIAKKHTPHARYTVTFIAIRVSYILS